MRTIRDGIYSYRWTQVQEWYRVVKANTMAPVRKPKKHLYSNDIKEAFQNGIYALRPQSRCDALRSIYVQTQEMPFMKSLDFGFQR